MLHLLEPLLRSFLGSPPARLVKNIQQSLQSELNDRSQEVGAQASNELHGVAAKLEKKIGLNSIARTLRQELISLIDSRVGESSAEAGGSLAAKAAKLATEIEQNAIARSLRQEFVSLIDEGLGDAGAQANNDLHNAVGKLTEKIEQNSIARSLRQEFVSLLDNGLGEVAAEGVSALTQATAKINDRIGIESTLQTTVVGPTVLATISPEVNTAVRIVAEIVAHRTDGLEAAIYNVLVLARAVPSSEILTVSGVPDDGSEVEIDGTTYKILDTPAAAFDVQRDAGTAEANIDNLVAAINLTGTPGTEYHEDTTVHPTFSASKASASTMEAVAKVPGTGANGSSVTDPTDVGGDLAWGAATTTGGLDMAIFDDGTPVTTEYEDAVAWDIGIAVNGSDVEISATGVADTSIEWKTRVRTVELFLS